MSSCAGPYTRVFFDAKDAAILRGLADHLTASGLTPTRLTLPRGRGGIDDLSCDMTFEDGTVIRVSKFLGPKGLLKRKHIYEVDFEKTSENIRGHVFDPSLKALVTRFQAQQSAYLSGALRDGVVAGAEAHERRIELCNGL